jgi:squalene-hopene/tetraprenyl-beta-curcumene cyclase
MTQASAHPSTIGSHDEVASLEVASQGDVASYEDAAAAMERATSWLKNTQKPEGYWKGELETNVTMDAEDVLLRHFLGILDEPTLAKAAQRLRSQQRPDGPWATFYGGPGELAATVEAYVVLRLAGDPPHAEHMAKASAWVREHGGVEGARIFTHIWLALVGLWEWEDLPVVPPELVCLPASWPLSVYSFGCWARQTVVALSVVSAHQPSRPVQFSIEELRSGEAPRRRPLDAIGAVLLAADKLLHIYQRSQAWPKRLLREAALKEAERWIIARQEADGSWGGIQPPMVYSTIALVLQGYPLDHPVVAAALKGLSAFTIDDEQGRRIEACQSPVWDTALAMIALADAGTPPDDPAMLKARDWLLGKEVTIAGDWAARRPGLEPGGWYFEFANVHYPDIDDTAEVVLALRRAAASPQSDAACKRALAWVAGMQCRGGGWGAFDADNDSELPKKLPFFDFGEVTDYPTEDVTAHVVEMLAAEARANGAYRTVLDRGAQWLLARQQPDGSYWGRWGVNYIYGAGAAVPALIAAGFEPSHPGVAGAVRWLLAHQNPDGGWGEDLRSYVEPSWRGRGASTASQTAWALMALIAAGEAGTDAVRRGVNWLVRTQNADGTWDEPYFTGTGFPWDFSLNYHLYRHVFPLSALGRFVLGTGPKASRRDGHSAGGVAAPAVVAPASAMSLAGQAGDGHSAGGVGAGGVGAGGVGAGVVGAGRLALGLAREGTSEPSNGNAAGAARVERANA